MTTFNNAEFARQLDSLLLAGQDNIARALREAETIGAFIQAERHVQDSMGALKAELFRTNEIKRDLVALLNTHRPPRILCTEDTQAQLTAAIKQLRSEAA